MGEDDGKEGETMSTQAEYLIFPLFNDIALEWGPRLWAFLNQPGNVRRMSEASDAGRPAAEAITAQLLETFGHDVARDRVKQYTGLLIRKVMEQHGYLWVRHGVRCEDRRIFSVASAYTHRMG